MELLVNFLNSCISAAKAHESLKTIDFDDFLILCDALAPQLFFLNEMVVIFESSAEFYMGVV